MDGLVVAINNWWVGGRETYVTTILDELRVSAVEASPARAEGGRSLDFARDDTFRPTLIASLVQKNAPGLDRFANVIECGAGPYASRWKSWLAAPIKPAMIWAHHYELFPAWLLSRIHGAPLVTTFHGPLIGDARSNDLMQSLGMTLAIHRGDVVSGVSEEVLEGLRQLAPDANLHLLPNAVAFPAAPPPPPILPPRRFVLITRRGKLEHIRQAALLFAAYARRVGGCRLVVADGEMELPERHAGTMRAALRQLGAKWALQQGARFLRSVPRIEFIGWTADPRRHIREADVVLGMGRVILEGLAEARITALIGYDAVHGVLTAERFELARRTNFSGRAMPNLTHDAMAEELLQARPIPAPSSISAAEWAPRVRELLVSSRAQSRDPLAETLATAIDHGAPAEEIFRIAAQSLTPQEIQTLYRVAEG